MRSAWVLVAAALAVAGGWLLLRDTASSGEGPDQGPVVGRPGRESAAEPPPELPRAATPRVGVVQGNEGQLVRDDAAGPWELHEVRLRVGAKGRVTGASLVEALGERFYVRAKTLAELDELRAQTLDVEPDAPIPASAVVAMLEYLGWRVAVRDPVVMIARRPPSEEPR